MNNFDRANHGSHKNQDRRIAHQLRQVQKRGTGLTRTERKQQRIQVAYEFRSKYGFRNKPIRMRPTDCTHKPKYKVAAK